MVTKIAKIGSRAQVIHGTAMKTSGGLTKKDLKYNKWGKIVSIKASEAAKKSDNLTKAGYVAKKGKFGAVKVKKSKSKSIKFKVKGGNITFRNFKDKGYIFCAIDKMILLYEKKENDDSENLNLQELQFYTTKNFTKNNEEEIGVIIMPKKLYEYNSYLTRLKNEIHTNNFYIWWHQEKISDEILGHELTPYNPNNN